MQTYIGFGTGDATKAFKEATQGLSMPNIIIFESTKEDIKLVSKLIHKAYPNTMSIGTISKVKFKSGMFEKKSLALLALFSDVEVSCGVIKELSKCPVLYIDSLRKSINYVDPGDENTICLEFCTGYEERLMTTLYSYLKNVNVPIFGTTAFSGFNFDSQYVSLNGTVYSDACVYAVIKNSSGKIKIYDENIYKMNSKQFYIATDVSEDGKTIRTIDNKPAIKVYCDTLGIRKDKLIETAIYHPFARAIKDKLVISAIKKLNADGSIDIFNKINKNTCIYILSLDDYQQIERNTIKKIKREMESISLIISYDCIHRYQLYEENGYLDTYLKNMSNLGPHFGIIGAGEQYKNKHMNQSMICAVFE